MLTDVGSQLPPSILSAGRRQLSDFEEKLRGGQGIKSKVVELVGMSKPFQRPPQLANVVLTNLMGDWGYQASGPWATEAGSVSAAIAGCRQLEEPEMVNLELGVVIDVWTGAIRALTKEERVSVLKDLLDAKDREKEALKEQMKALEDQKPVAFNWKRYRGQRYPEQ